MLYRIVVGLIRNAVGIGVMYFSGHLVEMFGDIEWADRNLGSTKNFYMLLGVFFCFVGFLYLFGVLGPGEMNKAMDTGFGSGLVK